MTILISAVWALKMGWKLVLPQSMSILNPIGTIRTNLIHTKEILNVLKIWFTICIGFQDIFPMEKIQVLTR